MSGKLTYLSIFDTNVLLTFESDNSELEQLWAESKVAKLEDLSEVER